MEQERIQGDEFFFIGEGWGGTNYQQLAGPISNWGNCAGKELDWTDDGLRERALATALSKKSMEWDRPMTDRLQGILEFFRISQK
jgi:hypothetical protein